MSEASSADGRFLKTGVVVFVLAVHLGVLAASASFLIVKPMPRERPVTFIDLEEPASPKPAFQPPSPPPPTKAPVQLPLIAEKATTPEQAAEAVPAQQTSPQTASSSTAAPVEPDYLPQFKIEQVPVLPETAILARTVYPPLAAKQGLEAVVYLMLYIDETGRIRNVAVLKDPGFGFAEAAVQSLEGVVVQPAQAQGKPVAVKFRYNMRFKLK